METIKSEQLNVVKVEPLTRPVVTQMVIDEFTKVLDAQDLKGVNKYGVTIDDADDTQYDWGMMAIEELADFAKYLVKDILRLKQEVAALTAQLGGKCHVCGNDQRR